MKISFVLFAIMLSCLSGCTPADRTVAGTVVATAGSLCVLVPILIGETNSTFAGSVCSDVAKLISTVLSQPSTGKKPAASMPCDKFVEIERKDGSFAGIVCAPFADAAQQALLSQ